MIENFYNGILIPIENFGSNDSTNYQVLSKQVQEREKELLETLSKEQMNLYKKIKNDTLDPLAQQWYKKKDILMATGGPLEDIIFSPELPKFLAEEWARLKGMYAFLSEIEAE